MKSVQRLALLLLVAGAAARVALDVSKIEPILQDYCDDNEMWYLCGPCEATCADQHPRCPRACVSMIGKCACRPGYVRELGHHKCVRVEECASLVDVDAPMAQVGGPAMGGVMGGVNGPNMQGVMGGVGGPNMQGLMSGLISPKKGGGVLEPMGGVMAGYNAPKGGGVNDQMGGVMAGYNAPKKGGGVLEPMGGVMAGYNAPK